MSMVKPGSRWSSIDKEFVVLSVTEVEGNTWVHYREDLGIKVPALQCKEYSCYQESFVQRFRPLPE
jgi:hypothetical protein